MDACLLFFQLLCMFERKLSYQDGAERIRVDGWFVDGLSVGLLGFCTVW